MVGHKIVGGRGLLRSLCNRWVVDRQAFARVEAVVSLARALQVS